MTTSCAETTNPTTQDSTSTSTDTTPQTPPSFKWVYGYGPEQEVDVLINDAKLSTVLSTATSGDRFVAELSPNLKKGPQVAKKVAEYLAHHKGQPPAEIKMPLPSKVMKDVVGDPWDAEFIDALFNDDKIVLYDLLIAANDLKIHGLLQLGCAKLGGVIKGQPLEKVRALLTPTTS